MAVDSPGVTADPGGEASSTAVATDPDAKAPPVPRLASKRSAAGAGRRARSNGARARAETAAPGEAKVQTPEADERSADLTEVVASPRPAAARPSGRKVRRARRVKRVIRRIELWSVLKLALVLYTCAYVAVMGALVVIWGFAHSADLVDRFESFANDIGFENWQFYGEHMFRQAAVIGGVGVVSATILTVLATALVNVVSELTGGIRVVVIEEETVFVTDVDEPADGSSSGPDESAGPEASPASGAVD